MKYTTDQLYTMTTNAFGIVFNALGVDSDGQDYTNAFVREGARLYVYDREEVYLERNEVDPDRPEDSIVDEMFVNRYAYPFRIECFPTHFTSKGRLYVYAAIERDYRYGNQTATIVYSPVKVDFYGRIEDAADAENSDGVQYADPAYFYVYLQGVISPNKNDGRGREWEQEVRQGAIGGHIVGDQASSTRANESDSLLEIKDKIDELKEYIENNSFFERHPLDTIHIEQRQAVSADGFPLYTDANGNETTFSVDDEGNPNTPVMTDEEVQDVAVNLKKEFVGLFSYGWMSAYGLNPGGSGSGSGSGSGGTIGDRLDEWSKYDKAKPQVLGANLGVDLHDRVIKLENKKYITSWNDLTDKPDFGKFAYKDLLTEDDIPQLSINKIINLQESLDSKLDKSVFDELFEKVTLSDGKTTAIKAKYGLFSVGFVSAYGQNDDESSSSGSIIKDRLDEWKIYTDDKAQWVLSAKLGVELYTALNTTVATSLADLDERIKAIAADPGEILSFPTKGSGNAVTSVIKSGTTVTVTKGATFQEAISDLATIRSNAANGNTAYGWGNHASAGYQKAISDLATIRSNAANGATAYGWGNHAIAGYLKGNQTITLSGDVSGSGTTSITTSIGAGKVTNAMLATGIDYKKLTKYSVTIAGTSIELGGSIAASTLVNNIASSFGTNKTAWGRTYWNASGKPESISGNMGNVGILYFGSEASSTPQIWYDSTNRCIRTNVGFVSDSFVSAYGLSFLSGALPLTGGTLTGNLRLKNSSAYGMKLNFGDGEYVYLHEDQDDRLLVYAAKGLLLRGSDTTDTTHNYVWIEKGSSSKTTSTGDKSDVVTVGSRLHIGSTWRGEQQSWQLYVDKDGGCTGAAIFNGNISVYGNISVNGSVVHSSDVRLKNIGKDVSLNIKDIADAPCFTYDYKADETKSLHIGSSAQYWRELLPNAVSEDNEGWLGLDYSAVNFAAVVALAKQSESHEERIKRLETENKELRNKIVELERA